MLEFIRIRCAFAICDADIQKSKEFGEKYSVNHYESLDDMISSEEFDGAFVVTPTYTHAEIAKITWWKKTCLC